MAQTPGKESAKPEFGGVTITLDKPRTLRFTGWSFWELERMTGKGLSGQDRSFTSIVWQIWAGLIPEDREVTPEMIAKHMDGHRFNHIQGALKTALVEGGWADPSAFEDEDGDTAENPTEPPTESEEESG